MGMTLKECVEKQIPQKVKIIENSMIINDTALRQANCPSCNTCVSVSTRILAEYNYCHNCGQRLKWGE